MKKLGMASVFCICTLMSHGQKLRLDTSVCSKWPWVYNANISDNGKYAAFTEVRQTAFDGTIELCSTMVRSINGDWHSNIDNSTGNNLFTSDNKRLICGITNNQFCIVQLGTGKREIIPNVSSFELVGKGKSESLLYVKYSPLGELMLKNLASGKERSLGITCCKLIAEDGESLLVIRQVGTTGSCIERIEINTGIIQRLWEGKGAVAKFICTAGNKVLFQNGSEFCLYEETSSCIGQIKILKMKLKSPNLTVDGIDRFSPSGNLLIVKLASQKTFAKDEPVLLSYQDSKFSLNHISSDIYYAIYDIQKNSLIQVTFEAGEKVQDILKNEQQLLISKDEQSEYYWNDKQRPKAYIADLQIGGRIEIGCNLLPSVSHDKSFIIGYHGARGGDIYVHDLASGKERNLTKSLPIPEFDNQSDDLQNQYSRGLIPLMWFANGTDLLIKDHYDIWKIDVRGLIAPKCLTNGFGRKNHIVLNAFNGLKYWISDPGNGQVRDGQRLFLTAYDEINRLDGFYKLVIGSKVDPQQLTMGPYAYTGSGIAANNELPIKAKKANIWLVKRSSANASPNYLLTKNFKTFDPVSSVFPERNYHWFTTELIDYVTKSGVRSQAILYKPDNLDSSKKYPVLFNFYEKQTLEVNKPMRPGYLGPGGYYFNYPISIAQGYLVCVPDIHFKLGQTALNIVDCVEGAADAIANRSYIDSAKFGAAGGSFGGYGINCLAAFSHKFKALVSVAGPSDLVSWYGNVPGLRDEEVENRQGRMGVSLSAAPSTYIKNSPVAFSTNISTPILLVQGAKDLNVNPQQSLEFFISLRREGKPSWLLWYPDEGHGVQAKNKNQEQFYSKMTEFFDYYLKGTNIPEWMINQQIKH